MITIKAERIQSSKHETIVLFLFKEDTFTKVLPLAYKNVTVDQKKVKIFKGEKGEKYFCPVSGNSSLKNIIFIGLGCKKTFTQNVFMHAVGDALKYASVHLVESLAFVPLHSVAEIMDDDVYYSLIAEVVYLSAYTFLKYKTRNVTKAKKRVEECIFLVSTDKELLERKKNIKKAFIISERVCAARDLINEPPNELTPRAFASRLANYAKNKKIACTVFGLDEIKKKKMGGLLAVSQGSVHKPAFVILRYKGRGTSKNKKTICLVGKGVCFDSGGLSLKPATGMITMKYDMAGAATCANVLFAAHELNLAHDVIALLPLCENMPDGNAYRPGDIVKTMSGLNIEIFNTDAEGRMILADALYYSKNFSPDYLVDVATLTGAAKICLGDKAAAILGNDDIFIKKLIEHGKNVGERLWQLPLWDEYQDDLKSDVADMKNIGLKGAGTVTAAKFLSNFIPETAWAHLDIASMAWEEEGKTYAPKGASGFGLRLLIDFLISL
jgi:leucyl aminopeptidase